MNDKDQFLRTVFTMNYLAVPEYSLWMIADTLPKMLAYIRAGKEKYFIIETEWNLRKETEEIVSAFSSCCLCCIWWFQKRYWYKLRCNNKININDERSDSVVTKKQMHLGNLTWEYLQTIETTKTIKWDRKYKY